MSYPGPPTTDHDAVPWGDDYMTVYSWDKTVGHGPDGTVYDLEYDDKEPNPDGAVCNALSTDGYICRLPRNHWDELGQLPHMGWTPDLVMRSGVYVLAIHAPGTVTP